MPNICPVCGYDELREPPYDRAGNPSYEICACCGYQFGFDDQSEGISYKEHREKWIAKGATWFSPQRKPENWSLQDQLRRINASL